MVNNNAPLLEMRNIQKDFFGNQVLTDINLTLREGEVLGLVGENGAGKSTLMKILFGMDVIRETGGYGGDVLIHGEKVSFSTPFDALKAGIGMVHQEFSLIPGFTATENILLNREPKKSNVVSEIFGDRLNTLDYKQMNERSAEAIKKMGVHIDQHMVISDMPVGHKQFTEIARELSKDNLKLLILDEPTAVLTEKEAAALLNSIRSMAARGISVIFITHRLQEILSVCDKVVIMRDGVVVSSKSISFSGMVTFSDLSTAGQTTINGSNITTGTIDAIDIYGCTIEGSTFRSILQSNGIWGGEIEFCYMNSNYTAGGIRLDANGAGSQYENQYRMFIYTNYIRGVSFAMKLQSAGGISIEADDNIYIYGNSGVTISSGGNIKFYGTVYINDSPLSTS